MHSTILWGKTISGRWQITEQFVAGCESRVMGKTQVTLNMEFET